MLTPEEAKNITNELANAGQNIRKYYQRRLPSDPSKDYYYILRNTPNIESVISKTYAISIPGVKLPVFPKLMPQYINNPTDSNNVNIYLFTLEPGFNHSIISLIVIFLLVLQPLLVTSLQIFHIPHF